MAIQATSTPPHGIPVELGQMLQAERERQGLTRLEVTLAIRQPEDRIRACESGYRPAWSALQLYVDFLGQKAPKGWMAKAEKGLDRAMRERLDDLSPAGRLTVKALMLKACRDSSVGRAAALPTSGEQLRLFQPRLLPAPDPVPAE